MTRAWSDKPAELPSGWTEGGGAATLPGSEGEQAVRVCFLVAMALIGVSAARAASVPAVEAAHGMVVSSQHLASEVGVDILRQGGNAVDAAVAVGYALAVVNPCCGNIGGGGFMVLHLADGRDRFIDFREMAPAAATADMFLDAEGRARKEASLFGTRAAGVPGTVAGLEAALTEYGHLPRAAVMTPAIALARDGFVLTRADTDIMDAKTAQFRRRPAIAKVFLRPDGTPLQPGDRLVQSDLAETLAAISAGGADAFYKGAIPQAVADAAKVDGGVITAADFAAYRVTEAAPLRCSYRGAIVLSAPPPSSGGATLCEILTILEGYDMAALGFHSAQSVHLMTEAMRHAYLDRNTFLGDPAFVTNPLQRLLSKEYAAAIRATITDRATPSKDLLPGTAPHEKPETTQYSIVDKDGNAVSVTYTINGSFGAMVIAGSTGFLLNDEMDDFTVKLGVPNLYGLVQGEANAIAPGKRPLSSMAPSIVTRDGKTLLVTGSPGGSRIITITLQSILNVIDFGMAPQEAVDAPRIHHQWLPDVLYAEPYALSPDTQALLRGMGYTITEQVPWGAAEMVEVGPDKAAASTLSTPANDAALSGKLRPGLLYGANDSRRPAGAAEGY
jgi:gamma-glutamyltranspeptidase/glutathione hydrolase